MAMRSCAACRHSRVAGYLTCAGCGRKLGADTSRWPVYTDPIRRADALRRALHDLKDAQELIRMAQAPYVLLKVKAARRSLEGAIRHAQGREHRQDHTRTVTKATRPRRIP